MRGKQPLREEIPHVLLLTQVCDCTALWPMVVTDAPRPPASSSSSTRRVRCNEYSLQKRKDGYMPGESFLMDLIGTSVMYSWHVAMLRESVRNVWTLWFTCHSGSQKDEREVCPGSVSLLRAILQRKCRHTERKKPSITIQVGNLVANTRLPQHWVSHIANVNHVTTEMLDPTAPNIPPVFSAREMSWIHTGPKYNISRTIFWLDHGCIKKNKRKLWKLLNRHESWKSQQEKPANSPTENQSRS